MFRQAELLDAINELEGGRHSIQNCEKLAAIYTVLDHLYPTDPQPAQPMRAESGYSRDSGEIRAVGKSEFIELINGKPSQVIWPLIEEFVGTVNVLNPRLYNSFITKLQDL